jgi:mannose-6-phosphate isomerase
MRLNKISFLKNPIQEYAWGSKTHIQALLGKPESIEKPMAELWMGAHPKAPSQVIIDGEWQSLDQVIKKDPESILGKNVAEKFSNQLPFLFKILAAERPLSVQVHPSIEQAREGFARENDLGIPLDAPNRNYRDANHKPEILCALTPFQGLKGFRKIDEILNLMDQLSLTVLSEELNRLKKEPDGGGLKRFFSSLMSMDKVRQAEVAVEAARSAEKIAYEDPAFQWIMELNKEYPGDIGILTPVILNLVQLEPGEAIYLPAGELHAYLDGLGIELMANSDNVLRGGLTPKHIDVPELLNVVNFESGPVQKVKPANIDVCRMLYETPAEEFQLFMISVDNGKSFTSPKNRSVEILICLKGEAKIEDLGCGESITVTQGQSIVIPSHISQYWIEGNATLYMASVPL